MGRPHRAPAVASSAAALSRTLTLRTCSTTSPFITSPASGPSGLRPRVGFNPTRPQHDAGIRMDPPPSLACATGTMRAATAAAAPPLEPPGVRSRSHGFLVGPKAWGSVVPVSPNSGVFVLPTQIKPAR